MNYNEKPGLRSNRRQSNRYIENNDPNQKLEPSEHFINHHVKICNVNRIRNPQNKRTLHAISQESIQNNNQINNNDKKRTGNIKDFERSSVIRHYGNENTHVNSENFRNVLNRDRRNVQDKKIQFEEPFDNKNEYLLKSGSENEKSAIKKHIQRLSNTELEELLNSLNEEKRALLKQIIDDDNINNAVGDGINKREITKKAGAVEDNNLIEEVQSNANKLQSSIPAADINTESTKSCYTDTSTLKTKTENSEQTDESPTKSYERNPESENKSDLTSRSYEINQEMLDNNIESGVSDNDGQNKADETNKQEMAVKSEAKRETNFNNENDFDASLEDPKLSENDYYNDKNEHDSSLNEEYNICPEYKKVAQINENELQSNIDKSYKREIAEKVKDMFDSVKALEESFPNTETIDVSSSNTGPLIRVKRTDSSKHNKTKRLTEIMPNRKIGYYPHKTDNLYEDYEEGSEFDTDIFYDRTSNLKSEDKDNNDASNNNLKTRQDKNLMSESLIKINENNEKGTVELGSDNDSVLSGVEGVDENLMFSSNLRKRRSPDKNLKNIVEDKLDDLKNLNLFPI